MAIIRWTAVALALCCAVSCSRKKAEINGIGKWVLLETQLREAPGFCNPDEISFCSNNGMVPIGDQPADVGLYFQGPEPTAPLVEISLSVRRCDPDKLARALIEVLGEPHVRKNKHYIWRGELAFVVGAIPSSGRRCEVSFVSTKDQKRVAELTAEAETTPTPSAR